MMPRRVAAWGLDLGTACQVRPLCEAAKPHLRGRGTRENVSLVYEVLSVCPINLLVSLAFPSGSLPSQDACLGCRANILGPFWP